MKRMMGAVQQSTLTAGVKSGPQKMATIPSETESNPIMQGSERATVSLSVLRQMAANSSMRPVSKRLAQRGSITVLMEATTESTICERRLPAV